MLRREKFSLLRGSGLKWDFYTNGIKAEDVLPLTREWIEIVVGISLFIMYNGSPSYEGVD